MRPTLTHLTAIVDKWNAAYPVGTPVTVRRDNGEIQETWTRSTAEVLSGHTPVIWLEGISGCYALERVTPRRPVTDGEAAK